jgi:hypothetical protein
VWTTLVVYTRPFCRIPGATSRCADNGRGKSGNTSMQGCDAIAQCRQTGAKMKDPQCSRSERSCGMLCTRSTAAQEVERITGAQPYGPKMQLSESVLL